MAQLDYKNSLPKWNEIDTGISTTQEGVVLCYEAVQITGAPYPFVFLETASGEIVFIDVFLALDKLKEAGTIDNETHKNACMNHSIAVETASGQTKIEPSQYFADSRSSHPDPQVSPTDTHQKHPLIVLQELVLQAAKSRSLIYEGHSIPELIFATIPEPDIENRRDYLFSKLVNQVFHGTNREKSTSSNPGINKRAEFITNLREICEKISTDYQIDLDHLKSLVALGTTEKFADQVFTDEAAQTLGNSSVKTLAQNPQSKGELESGARPAPQEDVHDQIRALSVRIIALLAGTNALSSRGNVLDSLHENTARVDEMAAALRQIEDAIKNLSLDTSTLHTAVSSGRTWDQNTLTTILKLLLEKLGPSGSPLPMASYLEAIDSGIALQAKNLKDAFQQQASNLSGINTALQQQLTELANLKALLEAPAPKSASNPWKRIATLLGGGLIGATALSTWLLVQNNTSDTNPHNASAITAPISPSTPTIYHPPESKISFIAKTPNSKAYVRVQIGAEKGLIWLPEIMPTPLEEWTPNTAAFAGDENKNIWNKYRAIIQNGNLVIEKK